MLFIVIIVGICVVSVFVSFLFVKKTGEKVAEKLVTIPITTIFSLIVVVCLIVF